MASVLEWVHIWRYVLFTFSGEEGRGLFVAKYPSNVSNFHFIHESLCLLVLLQIEGFRGC